MVFASFALLVTMFQFCDAGELIAVPQPRPELPRANSSPEIGQTAADKPAGVYQSACPALLKGEISAKFLAPIVQDECGERSPLALEALNIAGKTTLSSKPELNCRIATALAQWAEKLNETAEATYDAGVSTILTGNGYQCRRRNNSADGKISEHGFANAIDIIGFKLANGKDVLVERDWGDNSQQASAGGLFLRNVHKSACDFFTTVLGPDANQYHRDHLHFDLGCHGKGCTYLLCE
jgi:hypothetical protein